MTKLRQFPIQHRLKFLMTEHLIPPSRQQFPVVQVTSWEISPSLPTGLIFGTTNGSIWGTPVGVEMMNLTQFGPITAAAQPKQP